MRRLLAVALLTAVASVAIVLDGCASGHKIDPKDKAQADSIAQAKQDSAGKTDTIKKHTPAATTKTPQ
jgi:outer membrane murein-binding lipoprotein Lpp